MSEPRKFGWAGPGPPDQRDVLFSAPRRIVESLPAEVDLGHRFTASPWRPIWQQGNQGSCGAQTAARDILFDLMSRNVNGVMPSRAFIYYVARMIMGTTDQDSGVYNRDLLKGLAKYGWCDESLWPYNDNDYRTRPSQAAFDQAAGRKITEYLSVPQDLTQMKACLAGGDPFILGFSVYSSMLTAEVERTGDIPMPSSRDRLEGGHDVLCCGFKDSTQRFLICNSWGENWGNEGFGTLPYSYVTNARLAGDFWTVKKAAWPEPVPPPPPPPPPPGPTNLAISLVLDGISYTGTVARVS